MTWSGDENHAEFRDIKHSPLASHSPLSSVHVDASLAVDTRRFFTPYLDDYNSSDRYTL